MARTRKNLPASIKYHQDLPPNERKTLAAKEELTPYEINPALCLAKAEDMLLNELKDPSDVHAELGIPYSVLHKFLYEGSTPWVRRIIDEKYKTHKEQIEEAKKRREMLKPVTQEILATGVEMIKRSIRKLNIEEKALTVNQVSTLVDFLDKVDKWDRLNEETPTSISQTQLDDLTPEAMRDELLSIIEIDKDYVDWTDVSAKVDEKQLIALPDVVKKEDIQ